MSNKTAEKANGKNATRVTLGAAFLFAILALLFLCLLLKPDLALKMSKLSGLVDLPEAAGLRVMRMVWAAQLVFSGMAAFALFFVLKGRLRSYTTFALGAGMAVTTSLLTANITLLVINSLALVIVFGFRIRSTD